MGESIFIFIDVRSDFFIFISFFDEKSPSKHNSPRSVCLCHIKGTPGLNELMSFIHFESRVQQLANKMTALWTHVLFIHV